MPPITIEPIFLPDSGYTFFSTEQMNALAELRYKSTFGWYQAAFGMYGYLQLTSDQQYRIHWVEGQPYLWQPHNSCTWSPLGVFKMNSKTIEPCKSKINLDICNDEFFGSLYKDFHRWNTGASVELSASGQAAVGEIIKSVQKNATLGNRLMLTGGQLLNLDTIVAATGTSSDIMEAFRATANTCKGWIQLCKATGATAGFGHVDQNALFITSGGGQNISSDGKTFTGDVVALYDAEIAAGKADLQDAVMEGDLGEEGGAPFTSMFLVSPSVYRRAYAQAQTAKGTPIVNQLRLQQRAVTFAGRTRMVMYIDETPIIPIKDVTWYDKLTTGTSHFAYVTTSRTIQLGSNFAGIPELREAAGTEVAVAIQGSNKLSELGRVEFLSHNLSAVSLTDTNFIAGAYKFVQP